MNEGAFTTQKNVKMYASLFRNVFLPAHEKLMGRKTLVYLKDLEKRQWFPEQKLRTIQWLMLKKLLEHVYNNVPYYRQKFIGLGVQPSDIKTPADFQQLPLLTKADIQEHENELAAIDHLGRLKVKSWTGGSTGQPLRFAYSRYSYEMRRAGAIRCDRWTGWNIGETVLNIWGLPIKLPKGPLRRFKDYVYNRTYGDIVVNSYNFTEKTLEKCLKSLNRHKPGLIIAYATPMSHLAQFVSERKCNIHKPKAIITTAEMLYPEQRELIESVFECKIFNRYGSREVSLIAAECEKHNGLHLNIDNLYIEFIRDGKPVKVGEVGDVIVTDLNNYGMPFIRYKIGDIGVPSDEKCTCGRGFPLMERVLGRSLDMVVTSSGKYISGLAFNTILLQFQDIKQYQLTQEDISQFTVQIVPVKSSLRPFGNGLKDETLSLLKKEIANVVGYEAKIDIQKVDFIPPEESGKYRPVKCKVPVDFSRNSQR